MQSLFLSAAHCVDTVEVDKDVTIYLGAVDVNYLVPAKKYIVQKIIHHLNWDTFGLLSHNDVALIQENHIDSVEPVALNTNDEGYLLLLVGGVPVPGLSW